MHSKQTVPYEVKLLGDKKTTLCMRRKYDAQLFDVLDGKQIESMLAINKGHKIQTSGLGVKAFDPEHIPSSNNFIEFGASAVNNYNKWLDEIKKQGIDSDMVKHIIVFGNSMNQTSIDYDISRYHVKKTLLEALDLF